MPTSGPVARGAQRGSPVRPLSGVVLSPRDVVAHMATRLEHRMVSADTEHGRATVTVTPEAWRTAVRMCKVDPALDCAFFDFLTAVDLREEGFAVLCALYSVRHGHHVQVRSVVAGGRETPSHPSVADIYGGANWHERETYDMFGIVFEGHPGLEPRILTTQGFEGWPLRKDFLLTTREVKPWPGLKEPKEPDEEADGGGEPADAGPSAEEKARLAKEKAERAKRKAAEMRKRKAAERAAALEGAAEPGPTSDGAVPERSTPADHADETGPDASVAAAGADTGGPEGQPPQPDATPGVEQEGRHAGAVEQSGDRPAGQTPETGAPPGAPELGDDDEQER